jgi:general secretion pathway protein D
VAGGLLVPALPLLAQRPVPGRPASASQTGGSTFDFDQADIRSIINAIATAGGLNVGYRDLPKETFTLHEQRPVGNDAYVALLQRVVDDNGLTMTQKDGLFTIIGPPPVAADATKTSKTPEPPKLYVYHLLHANASRLAAVLRAIFSGASVPRDDSGQQQLQQTGGGDNGGGGAFSSFSLGGGGNQGGNNDNGNNDNGGGGGGVSNGKGGTIIIIPEGSTNSLLVRATPDDWDVVRAAIDAVDLRPRQVMIEVVIVEVQHTDNLNLGVSVNGSNQRTFGGRTLSNTSVTGDTSSAAAGSFLESLTRYGAVDLHVAIAALQARGDVHVLSRPLIFAENNVQSQLLVGASQPFVQSSVNNLANNQNTQQVVQYRDIGTVLTILPTINPDGYVNLKMQQQIEQATGQVQFGAPIFSKRQAITTLYVKDGQTAVIGGLAGSQDLVTNSGIPVLSSLPFLGQLFRTTVKTKQQTELFLFLTPHIVQSDSDVDYIRQELRKHSDLLHKVPSTSIIGEPTDSAPPQAPRSGKSTSAQPLRPSKDATAQGQVIIPAGQP